MIRARYQGFYPDTIIVERSIVSLPYTQKILNTLQEIPVEVVDDVKEVKKQGASESEKNTLLIIDYKGSLIKKCPGSQGVLCCNYYVANLINGCPYRCSYCILQDYLNCGSIMVCANIDKFFEELRSLEQADYVLRFGTGELADSLALDPILHLTDELLPRITNYPHTLLELKTKSANIERIVQYNVADRVIIAWSLNPQEIVDRYEAGAAPLSDRLDAAYAAVSHGYRVAFHFDPIIMVDNWKEKYELVIEQIFERIPDDKILWISLGGLRFPLSLKRISQRYHPGCDMFSYGEFSLCPDGKFRYFRPLRVPMYRSMAGKIRTFSQKVPIYLCMETPEVWKEVFSHVPCENENLSLLYRPFPCKPIRKE